MRLWFANGSKALITMSIVLQGKIALEAKMNIDTNVQEKYHISNGYQAVKIQTYI